MKFITKAGLVVLFATIAVASDNLIHPPKVLAQSSGPAVVAQATSADQQATTPAVTYNYVAQAGDSYTVMARKAAQTYGKKYSVNLSLAQIVYIETKLTQAAGSPYLNQGDAIGIAEATIKQWVDKAQALGADEQAAWNYYVQFVDFNTDGVGAPAPNS